MISKEIILMFPGQGSQYVGMGKQLCEKFPSVESFFDQADQILDLPLKNYCFEGPAETLKQTEITQPAILTHSIAMYHAYLPLLREHGFSVRMVLGHSVGEYAALVAAGAISFQDAVKAVHLRGKFMQQAVKAGHGKMTAVLKGQVQIIKDCIQKVDKSKGIVEIANFNSPDQIVISGSSQAVDTFKELIGQLDPKVRLVDLEVSAPFHCSLMAPASHLLSKHFESIKFNPLETPYIANVDACLYKEKTGTQTLKQNLIDQVAKSVLWSESVLNHVHPQHLCLEIGPGQVLKGLLRRIVPQTQALSVDRGEFEELLKGLKQ